jgi:glycosyltransferase involved in cell wall biosynthesis
MLVGARRRLADTLRRMADPIVALVAEQLFQRPAGGIGTYVRGLLRCLPGAGVRPRPVIARHPMREAEDAALDEPIALPLPHTALYESWGRTGRPRIPAEIDIVHAPSLVFPFAERRPVVVTVHDIFFRTYPETYTRRGIAFHERGLRRLSRAAAVLCPSEATAALVRALPETTSSVAVTPLGCDLQPAPEPAIDRVLDDLGIARPYVLWIGTREPRKNLRGAIEAFAAARARGIDPRTSLVLAGPSGWGSDPTAERVAALGLTDRVTIPGYIAEGNKAALLSGAAAFLFPSRAEGFGLPVLEAMACGTPVITSDVPALREVAGDAAMFGDPSDPEVIAERLTEVLREPTLAAELRERGRSRASAFTWERTADLTAAVYRDVIDR